MKKNICSKGIFKYYIIWDYGNSCLTIGEGPNLKDFIYFILIMFGVFLGKITENYKQESQNNFKSKIDYIKNSEVLNSIDTLVTYRDSVLLIFK